MDWQNSIWFVALFYFVLGFALLLFFATPRPITFIYLVFIGILTFLVHKKYLDAKKGGK